uniref:Uncharacterized protein n=1 Tax=Physcomitrium patens TaxID=3218 RepID=A0A7I3ZKG5_PHYPA
MGEMQEKGFRRGSMSLRQMLRARRCFLLCKMGSSGSWKRTIITHFGRCKCCTYTMKIILSVFEVQFTNPAHR